MGRFVCLFAAHHCVMQSATCIEKKPSARTGTEGKTGPRAGSESAATLRRGEAGGDKGSHGSVMDCSQAVDHQHDSADDGEVNRGDDQKCGNAAHGSAPQRKRCQDQWKDPDHDRNNSLVMQELAPQDLGEPQRANDPKNHARKGKDNFCGVHGSFLFIALIAAAGSLRPDFVRVVPKLLSPELAFREAFNAHALGWRDGGFPCCPLAHRGLIRTKLFSRPHLPTQVKNGLLDRLDYVIHAISVSAMPMCLQALSTCIADNYR